jgi:hypothetical protein
MSIQAERAWLMIAIDLAKMQRDIRQKASPTAPSLHQPHRLFAPNVSTRIH